VLVVVLLMIAAGACASNGEPLLLLFVLVLVPLLLVPVLLVALLLVLPLLTALLLVPPSVLLLLPPLLTLMLPLVVLAHAGAATSAVAHASVPRSTDLGITKNARVANASTPPRYKHAALPASQKNPQHTLLSSH
jgi:hypothetical protein